MNIITIIEKKKDNHPFLIKLLIKSAIYGFAWLFLQTTIGKTGNYKIIQLVKHKSLLLAISTLNVSD
jgi:hypothetical protein